MLFPTLEENTGLGILEILDCLDVSRELAKWTRWRRLCFLKPSSLGGLPGGGSAEAATPTPHPPNPRENSPESHRSLGLGPSLQTAGQLPREFYQEMPKGMVSSTSLFFKLCYQEPSGMIYFEQRSIVLEQKSECREIWEKPPSLRGEQGAGLD